jgi:radical SAM superfamily enzyme YgiQ (UPF0313 family)
VKKRPGAGRRGAKSFDWLAQEKRLLEIRFPRRPQSVILFPAPYPTAIANLGFMSVWQRLNTFQDFSCDRAFWDPQHPQPVRSLETDLPLRDFPLIFISSSSELDLAEVIKALLASDIEPSAKLRGPKEPFIIGGGITLSLNPAPWTPILNLALLGEGEEALTQWMRIYQRIQERESDRGELMAESSHLPFAFIPSMPRRPLYPAVSLTYMEDPAASPVIHPLGHFGECYLIEMTRGCPRLCRFCAVCGVYPPRFAKEEAIRDKIGIAKELRAPKVGLLGGAVGDHPALRQIADEIVAKGREITVSSLRIERSEPELLQILSKGGLKTLTVAPETGSDDLRQLVGKKVANDEIIALAGNAARAGIKILRLYFLIGLPEKEPPQAIVNLVKNIRKEVPRGLKLDLSVSSFIPKPGTPWERAPFADLKELDSAKKALKTKLQGISGVTVHFEASKVEREMALLSRGDEILGEAMLRAVRAGRPLEQEMRMSGLNVEKYLDFTAWRGETLWEIIARHAVART